MHVRTAGPVGLGLPQHLAGDRGDLADISAVREASRAAAIDALRERFGAAAVQRGLGFAPQAGDQTEDRGKDRGSKVPPEREPR